MWKKIYNDDCTIESKTISKTPIYKLYIYICMWIERSEKMKHGMQLKKVHERDLK